MGHQTLNIFLVLKSGGDFSLRDVELLSARLLSAYNENVNIYCLTDLCTKELKLRFCTFIPMPFKNWAGWWSKLNLFHPSLEQFRPYLFMDLDTVVFKALSFNFFNEPYISSLITLRDFYKPGKPASGIMWIPAKNDKVFEIWNVWIKSPEIYSKKFRGDQDFISFVAYPDYYIQDLCPKIVTFKPHKMWRKEITGQEEIVCFHGKPRIWEAAKSIEWVKNYCNGF